MGRQGSHAATCAADLNGRLRTSFQILLSTWPVLRGLQRKTVHVVSAVQALVKDDLHRDVAGHVTRQPLQDGSTEQLPVLADDVQQPLLNGSRVCKS